MKKIHLAYLGLSIFLVFIFIRAEDTNITGAASYAVNLDHLTNNFYETQQILFPQGTCAQTAQDLYENVALPEIEQSNKFKTQQLETINFAIDNAIGTIELVKEALIHDSPENSYISINADTVVRTPPGPMRMTYFTLDIYGYTEDSLYITRGEFTTPTTECTFIATKTGEQCDCTTHKIQGIKDE